ncbi:CapA family protein [Legionella jordanis]|uniref:Capsule biosynthesis protein n=1 Tax=Legionella jordanis TaxID=456 RepID=A0A0W0VD93_9GAMM|nr:CapA family protein [Legionella jordanis]KTD18099.1 capsule biosynthesis protein [Legionella jordanis]RMX00588.1 CapA family protein [Legionella jordanis]RMX21296.1 CapA family protein [Legionella jordanis]VEH13808.1 capsule biosynthesis protein [Legionella jordanis]
MNPEESVRVILAGDVMLGRLVREAILLKGKDYPLGMLLPLMRQGDLVLANLECAITNYSCVWSGMQKAFYFQAPPEAAQILSSCGIRVVSLANNHILDFDIQGLLDTVAYLEKENIAFAGAGETLAQARSPVYFEIKNCTFAMVAFCDHHADFAASKQHPGMAYLNLRDRDRALQQLEGSLFEMRDKGVDWPILSLHWGPNMVFRPAKAFIELAHDAIEMGYKLIFGHSAHVFQGIEVYKGCPIVYAAGDLVDDYYVDPKYKNDHQLLIELDMSKTRVKEIKIHPIFIAMVQTKPNDKQFEYIALQVQTLSAELGTLFERGYKVLRCLLG